MWLPVPRLPRAGAEAAGMLTESSSDVLRASKVPIRARSIAERPANGFSRPPFRSLTGRRSSWPRRRPAAGGRRGRAGRAWRVERARRPSRGLQLAGEGEVVARPGNARDGEAGGGLVQGIGSYLMSSPLPSDRCPGRRLARPTQDYKDAYFMGHSLPSAARKGKIGGQCAISAAHARSLLVHLVRRADGLSRSWHRLDTQQGRAGWEVLDSPPVELDGEAGEDV